MPTSARTIRPPTLWLTCRPNRVSTHPKAATNAPTSFIAVGAAFCAGLPSSGLIFKNPNRLTSRITTPTTNANLPEPEERYAIPTHARVNPTRNVANERPCPVFAAMHCLLDPVGSLTKSQIQNGVPWAGVLSELHPRERSGARTPLPALLQNSREAEAGRL